MPRCFYELDVPRMTEQTARIGALDRSTNHGTLMTLDLAEHYQWMYGDELAESTRLRELLTRLAVGDAELRRRT